MPPVFRAFTWFAEHAMWVYLGMGGVFLLVVIMQLTLGRRRAASLSYGSARWATPREVAKAGMLGDRGVILGQYGYRYLRDDSEAHILLVAPTRAGKGVGVIIPTLLTWPESVLVTDPKDGENYDVSHRWRERLGPVLAFTLRRKPETRINVLEPCAYEPLGSSATRS
jgi:type IV secretion system protein VirD4